jgi:hypothetical protein
MSSKVIGYTKPTRKTGLLGAVLVFAIAWMKKLLSDGFTIIRRS